MAHGNVQGVFFRDSTRREAERRGVAGWARNSADGTVEAVFEGDAEAVEAMIAFVRGGPGHSSVARWMCTRKSPRTCRDSTPVENLLSVRAYTASLPFTEEMPR